MIIICYQWVAALTIVYHNRRDRCRRRRRRNQLPDEKIGKLFYEGEVGGSFRLLEKRFIITS